MLRRLPVATVLVILLSASAYGWVSMGDAIPKVRPTSFPVPHPRPGSHPARPAADATPARSPGVHAPALRPQPAGQLPVRALRWVAVDGASVVELPGPVDLLTEALSPPEGDWADVEVLLGEGAWLGASAEDWSGQTLTLTLSDPDAAGSLILELPDDGDPASALLVPWRE